MKLIHNNNIWRCFTGLLLGYGLGTSVGLLCASDWLYGTLLVAWIFGLEFIVVIVLQRAKVLDAYIKEYEDGVYRC